VITVYRSDTRGETKAPWLESRHSFSFNEYFDPKRTHFGALVALNEDRIAPGGGFPRHSHENMEIVTIVLSGGLAHEDSSGGKGVIRAGEVQHMSAGTGITHSEHNASSREETHLLQVWIEPEEENIKPSYEQRRVAWGEDSLRAVVSPAGPVHIRQDATFYLAKISPGESVRHDLLPDRGAFVFVINGVLGCGRNVLRQGDAAEVTDQRVQLKAKEHAQVLVIDVPV
jgi:redox-sensitive bicupin YhaK (pirin superfamily)